MRSSRYRSGPIRTSATGDTRRTSPHSDAYTERVSAEGADGVEAYLSEHLDKAGSFKRFLDQGLGATVLLEQRRRAQELVAV